ncbi:MAG: antitoxin VapB family protein [Thermoplasmatota archaeon]
MTKTVSLADDAYEALARVKRPSESFSELARRAAKELARQHLFDRKRKPIWTDKEEADLVRRIYAARDEPARRFDT